LKPSKQEKAQAKLKIKICVFQKSKVCHPIKKNCVLSVESTLLNRKQAL